MRDLPQGMCQLIMHAMRDTQTIMSDNLRFIKIQYNSLQIMLSLKINNHITQCILLLQILKTSPPTKVQIPTISNFCSEDTKRVCMTQNCTG